MRYAMTLIGAACAVVLPATASAHFPFLHLKGEGTNPPALHLYFAETAEPDDPALLEKFAGVEALRVEPDGKPQTLALKKGDDSLVAPAPGSGPATYGLTKEYGLLSRGSQPAFLLMYYAKTHSGREAWAIDTTKSLALDISPKQEGDNLTLTVSWKGKPLPEAEVVLQGGIESIEGKTDAEGRFTCALPDPDLYSIRAKHVEAKSGERDGKRYTEIRHYSTLTLDLN